TSPCSSTQRSGSVPAAADAPRLMATFASSSLITPGSSDMRRFTPSWLNCEGERLGSIRVSRVGERVLAIANFCLNIHFSQEDGEDCFGATPKPTRDTHDLMTWVTLFPLRSAAVRPCTPRHF